MPLRVAHERWVLQLKITRIKMHPAYQHQKPLRLWLPATRKSQSSLIAYTL